MSHLACVLAIVLLLVCESAMASPSCQKVTSEMHPCLPYLRGQQAQPSRTCCNGVSYVGGYFNSNSDRKAVCECLSSAAASAGQLVDSALISLPKKCHVSVILPPISDGGLKCSRF